MALLLSCRMEWIIFQDPQPIALKDVAGAVAKIESAGIKLHPLEDGALWAIDPEGVLEERKKMGKVRELARTRMASLRKCAHQINEYLRGKHGNEAK